MRSNLIGVAGDTQTITVTLTDAAGDPLDLTGGTVWFSVGGIITKRTGEGIVVADPDSGVAVITLDPDDTGSSTVRRSYPYDVQVLLADGTVKTPIRGRFVLVPDVTTETT